MKHILHLVCIALSLVCGAHIAMAFTPGLPPQSGPGSLFYGQPEKGGDPAVPTQNPNESTSRRNKGRAPACAKYSRNDPNKRHLLGQRNLPIAGHLGFRTTL